MAALLMFGSRHASLMSSGDANVRYKLMWRAMVKDISVFQTPEGTLVTFVITDASFCTYLNGVPSSKPCTQLQCDG